MIAFGIIVTSYRRWKPIIAFILAFIALIIVGIVIDRINAAAKAAGTVEVFFIYEPGIFFAVLAPITFLASD